ncbi:hypothetical protein AB0P37_08370 [Streptomyces antimycoticus]|uniref:hypothetical protein n=1 Tax=Streptomyces antimycoticus TaxID=68175 RepID=UPI00342A8AFB
MEITRLRLLPWTSQDGKPCYTPDHAPDSHIARLADRVEAEQVATAEAVLALSAGFLEAGARIEPDECVYIMKRLTECLRDALRLAQSRGGRLPAPNPLEPEAELMEGTS